MDISEQVRIMENQIHSTEASFTLMEKMAYMAKYFDPDPMFTKEARDIVRSNICKSMKPSPASSEGEGETK